MQHSQQQYTGIIIISKESFQTSPNHCGSDTHGRKRNLSAYQEHQYGDASHKLREPFGFQTLLVMKTLRNTD